MNKFAIASVVMSSLLVAAAQAADTKPLVLPPVPKEIKSSPPFGAQPTPNGGVYVPVTKSGNYGVSVEPLRSPVSNDRGATVNVTRQNK
jgi:hypothetical protein